MRNYIIFAGKDSRDFGVYISGSGTYNSPEKEYTFVSIPGKSGDLIIDEKRFKNVPLSYPAFIYTDMKENIEAFRNFLLSQNGYQRLEDTYHPDEFRLATFRDRLEVSPNYNHEFCSFDISFTCKPQRFLKIGEKVLTFTSSSQIYNPTNFDAKPLLRIYGVGSATIGNTIITISSANTYTDIDCELMIAYKGVASKNAYVSMSTIDYPVIKPGTSSIGLGSGISKIEITPRWYRI